MNEPILYAMEHTAEPSRTAKDERGTSLVEFSLIVTLLVTLLLGIVIFGVLLSKRQVLTQAAAEGARFAVPVNYTFFVQDNVLTAARFKTNQSLVALGGGRQCPAGTISNGVSLGTLTTNGIRCTFRVFDCVSSTMEQTQLDSNDCIEVVVEVAVKNGPPLVPGSSLIDPVLPTVMTGRSVVSLSGLL